MTNNPETFERPVMRSSVTPSLKYSCAGSWLRFAKGSTATDGLSGSGSPADSGGLSQRQLTQPAAPSSNRTATDAVAEMDADAESQPARGRELGVACLELALDVDRALHGVDDARELRQYVVARRVHHAPAMAGHRGCDDRAVLGDGAYGRHLVVAHEPAVAFNIRAQDRGEAALDGTPAHRHEFYRAREGASGDGPRRPGLGGTTSSPSRRPAWRLRATGARPSSGRRPRWRTTLPRWSRSTCAEAAACRRRA